MDEEAIKDAVCACFAALGFKLVNRAGFNEGGVDLIFAHPTTHQRWSVETKGETSKTGDRLDRFEAGLGQLVHRMSLESDVFYGLALPVEVKRRQNELSSLDYCHEVSSLVRQYLRLHWVLVYQDKHVDLLCPLHCSCQLGIPTQ